MNKTIKKEFLPGGARRQELLEQVPNYLRAPGFQGDKHLFCLEVLKLTETEYLEALEQSNQRRSSEVSMELKVTLQQQKSLRSSKITKMSRSL